MSPDEKPPPTSRSRSSRTPQQPRRGGLLTEIRTPVLTEPFQERYSLSPGRELGRWNNTGLVVRKQWHYDTEGCKDKQNNKTKQSENVTVKQNSKKK
uniref:Uncharacterized protein n=1 Tax=Sphaerodactylus townsendi TaxID=933632 RepID=A0ACB8FUM8_9SAUR